MKLELYYQFYCPFCQIVLRKIKSLNAEDKIILVDTSTDQEAAQKHRELTGRNTVPCLYIDGKPMFESSDISSWLEKNLK